MSHIIYDKCELLIRTQQGRLINLGRIINTSVKTPEYGMLDVFSREIHVVSGSTSYTFEVINNSGDYDGDELFGNDLPEINPDEWEKIIKE